MHPCSSAPAFPCMLLEVHERVSSWSRDCQAPLGSSSSSSSSAEIWICLHERGVKKNGLDPRFSAEVCVFTQACRQTSGCVDSNVSWRCSHPEFSSLQTCFEGTFSLQQANVLLILMASLVVSSFGDVHKWCMNAVNGFFFSRGAFVVSCFCVNRWWASENGGVNRS